MISWIQRTFQHHFKVVFAVLLAITIISFIITIGASPGIGRADRRVTSRDFFGYNLAARGDMQRMMNDAGLSSELQLGYGGADEEQIKAYAMQRVAALHLADELHIPPATIAEEKDYIEGLRIFADDKGQFDAGRYATFRENLRRRGDSSEAEIARVIADDVRASKIQMLLNGPGYILPADVKLQLAVVDTSWTVAVATVDYSSFKPVIEPADADFSKFYQDNAFRYQIQPRVSVGYLDFPAADYLGKVKLADADIRAYYESNKGKFEPPAPAKPGAAAAAADFAAVRPKVEAALRLERAQRMAAKEASDAAFALYDGKVTAGASLDSFLSSRKLALKPLAPFTQDAGPAELGGSAQIAEAAFKLNASNFYSEALPGPEGAVLLIWKETLPARTPLLAEVKDKVRNDFIESARRERFVALGRALRDRITGLLKTGSAFDKAAAAAAAAESVKVDVKAFPAFTLRSQPKDIDPPVLGALEHLDKGGVSEMVLEADKGRLVYAQDKKAPDLSESSPNYAAMHASISAAMARIGSIAALDEIVAQELKRTEPTTQ